LPVVPTPRDAGGTTLVCVATLDLFAAVSCVGLALLGWLGVTVCCGIAFDAGVGVEAGVGADGGCVGADGGCEACGRGAGAAGVAEVFG
jgi:hypothetical protein